MSSILGVSGLAESVRFKREHWPGLEEREYRIAQGFDAAAALVVNGVVVAAAAEERFNRQKQTGDFPAQAIGYCLKQAGLALADVDEIAHCFDYAPFGEIFSLDATSAMLYEQVFSKQALLAQINRHYPQFSTERVHQVSHHLSHAASAYFTSGWDECLVVVLDAMGETQSGSIFRGRGARLEKLREISANDSIGILYSLVTYHLGFDFNSDEYKIMGLAPYGDPRQFEGVFQQMLECRTDGSVRIPILRLNRSRDERENYSSTREWLSRNLIPPRDPGDEITQVHRDVAAALQATLNRAILHICGHFGASTGMRKIAMAGGVALNCSANGKLTRSGLFDEVYVQPAAGDDGAALGAALHRTSLRGEIINKRFPVPLLGPSHPESEVDDALKAFAGAIKVTRLGSIEESCERAAKMIAEGKVLAWHRGRMEYGPRALGNRSILADPSNPEMRDRVNAMVKKREAFRPFAPAVSIEQVDRWFDVAPMTSLPYMIATVNVREQYREMLPAITHVDGTARVQTVGADDNPAFHALLKAIGRETGREIVLNTSFNVKGQPIVNTPREAVETFLGTGIDCLFIEGNFVSRA
ncbi:MAG TPA: carbamoyltransferase C-terminal domain-containing protein [Bryobacteraceae bacterium]|nr:carbamoyltransferase C-terminal domain-containing protein [Bryobacteraceae bacterium]